MKRILIILFLLLTSCATQETISHQAQSMRNFQHMIAHAIEAKVKKLTDNGIEEDAARELAVCHTRYVTYAFEIIPDKALVDLPPGWAEKITTSAFDRCLSEIK